MTQNEGTGKLVRASRCPRHILPISADRCYHKLSSEPHRRMAGCQRGRVCQKLIFSPANHERGMDGP